MSNLISKKDAVHHKRKGVDGYYYQLPEINEGTTIAYAEFTAEHGERTIGNTARIYYILEGQGEFVIDGERFPIKKGDVISVPPHSTYNLFPKDGVLKVILVMELLDINKLPKK